VGITAHFGGEPHSAFPYPGQSTQRVASFVRIASLAAAPSSVSWTFNFLWRGALFGASRLWYAETLAPSLMSSTRSQPARRMQRRSGRRLTFHFFPTL